MTHHPHPNIIGDPILAVVFVALIILAFYIITSNA